MEVQQQQRGVSWWVQGSGWMTSGHVIGTGVDPTFLEDLDMHAHG